MENQNTAYVQYTVNSGVFEFKLPSVGLKYIGGEWKVDTFGDLFSSTCGDNKCQTTETFNKYTEELYCPLDCFGESFI